MGEKLSLSPPGTDLEPESVKNSLQKIHQKGKASVSAKKII